MFWALCSLFCTESLPHLFFWTQNGQEQDTGAGRGVLASKIPQVTVSWVQPGPGCTPLPTPPRDPSPGGNPPVGPRGSPLSSWLAASENPEGGGRGGMKKTLESSLDSKEIKLVHPKGNQHLIFIGRTDADAEAPILWPPDAKS